MADILKCTNDQGQTIFTDSAQDCSDVPEVAVKERQERPAATPSELRAYKQEVLKEVRAATDGDPQQTAILAGASKELQIGRDSRGDIYNSHLYDVHIERWTPQEKAMGLINKVTEQMSSAEQFGLGVATKTSGWTGPNQLVLPQRK